MEFDSQRPYPKRSDFGVEEEEEGDTKVGKGGKDGNVGPINDGMKQSTYQVTSEEIRPVADCLRKAFGLELFGFDILVLLSFFKIRFKYDLNVK